MDHMIWDCPRHRGYKYFCESRTGRKGPVLSEIWGKFGVVNVAGGQVMHSLGLMTNIPVMIQGRNLPADLIIVHLKNHEVILGMDWLGKYWASLDCHKGCVRFHSGVPPIKFQVLRPALGKLVVSAIRAERMLDRGCEANLATITTMEHDKSVDLNGIPLVSEFEDEFRTLQGVPP